MSLSDYSGSCSDTDSSDNDDYFMDDISSDDCDFDSNIPMNSLEDKNGTQWKTDPPIPTRTAAENTLQNRFGVAPWISQNVNNVADSFRVFFNEEMYAIILKYTNQHGAHIFGNTWVELDQIELNGFIGCVLFMGVHRDNLEPISELFGPDEGRKIYRNLFTLNRFRQIMRSLHFDDMETRDKRKEANKFCHIDELWSIWTKLLIESFRPLEDLCIDEQLVAFRGRCKFKQYMPSKPAKYGIKFFLLADPESTYVSNISVYLGKRSNEAVRAVNVGKNIVLHLLEPFYGSGRNVVCDNFFTSVDLAEDLLQRKITLVGTMRSNKREIPPYLRPKKNSQINSSLFVFHEKQMMLRYLPRKNKPVYMLCSSTTNVNTATEPPHKPDIIVYYNAVKCGVDTIARLLASVSVKRITRRWPLVVFFNMIDISFINAFCIYKNVLKSPNLVRRDFLKMMAEQLAGPLVSRKHQNVTPMNPLNVSRNLSTNNTYSRCRYCVRKRDRKTTVRCDNCSSPCCKIHSKCICTLCLNN